MVCVKAAGGAGNRVNEDGSHQGAGAADAVGDESENEAADGGGDEREGIEEAGSAGAHAQLANEVGENQRVEHDVHGVEHPAETAGDQRRALGGQQGFWPCG